MVNQNSINDYLLVAREIGNYGEAYVNEGGSYKVKYLTCTNERDKICGLLQCHYDNATPDDAYNAVTTIPISLITSYVRFPDERNQIVCAVANFKVGM